MTDITEAVARAIIEVSNEAPCNLQDDHDVDAHSFFVLSQFMEACKSQYSKHLDRIRANYRALPEAIDGYVTEHYEIKIKEGTPSERFSKDEFIANVAAEFDIPKHKLVELATKSTKTAAAPLSVSVSLRGF